MIDKVKDMFFIDTGDDRVYGPAVYVHNSGRVSCELCGEISLDGMVYRAEAHRDIHRSRNASLS